MIPRRADPWWEDEADALPVLVPGLFGLGFVISLLVLAFDGIARLLPAAGKRRRALLVRDADGRSRDLAAIRTGRPPVPAAVPCEPRSRSSSAAFGLVAGGAALAALAAGFAVADHVGVDRRAWALTIALVVAVPLALAASAWLAAALLGARSPGWLQAIQSTWPFGTYPRFDFTGEFEEA